MLEIASALVEGSIVRIFGGTGVTGFNVSSILVNTAGAIIPLYQAYRHLPY